MSTLHSKSLAQIVNENHRSAYVFEKYQIDFCCKGKRPLQQACDELSVPVEQVISELTRIADVSNVSIDFHDKSLTNLADYIVLTHHDYVKREMPLIYSYLQKVASKHGQRHPEMLKVFDIFSDLKEDMLEHMHKEELILFPRIKMLDKAASESTKIQTDLSYLNSPITMMEVEHEHAGDLLKEIRELTKNYMLPGDVCTTFRLSFAALQAFEMDLHHHVHLENNILFPKAIDLFNVLTGASLN